MGDRPEQRRWPRLRLSLQVELRFADVNDVLRGETLDIAREGVFIHTETPRPVGTPVRIRVGVESSAEGFTLEGVVKRIVEPGTPGATAGFGIALVRVSAGWDRFCDELDRRKAERAAR